MRHRRLIPRLSIAVTLVTAAMSTPSAASPQSVDGYVSILADALPSMQEDPVQRQRVAELRARLFAQYRREIGSRIRLTASGFVEGLAGDRVPGGLTRAAIVRPQELHLEAAWAHADLRVGYSRIVWGRLDEFLPTDVVNPLDLTRFFFEGRSEGRMAASMIRARWLPSDKVALEGVYVPLFRPGRFDQLDEASAPFNLTPRLVCPEGPSAPCATLDIERVQPARTLGNAQGGVRAAATTGRVDWAVSLYRGFEPLPLYALVSSVTGGPSLTLGIEERFPRFTMVGGDFETVTGEWGVRGEVAAFVERTLQDFGTPDVVPVRALEAGIGVDRKAGAYRVSGNVLLSRRWPTGSSFGSDGIDRTDVTLVAAVDRSFARETRTVRAFGVYNPGEESAFARVIAAMSLRDNLWIEASGGWFRGDAADALSRLTNRDFVSARLKVFF